MSRTIIKPGLLIDGTGGAPMEAPAVVVEDGRIAWVGRAADLAEDIAGAEVVLAPEKTLLPGLIDAHVHLVCDGGGQTPREYLQQTDHELLFTALANAQAGLKAGVTTMRDVGGRSLLVPNLRDAIDAGRVMGPRILAAGPAITTTGGHFYYFGWEADTAEQAVAALRALCKSGVDFIKVMVTGGNSTPGTNARESQYTAEQLSAIVEDAHRMGRRVAGHVHGVPGIRNAVDAGIDTLEHCSWLGEAGIQYEEALTEEMVRKGLYVSLALPARYRVPPEAFSARMTPEQERTSAMREARLETVRKMIEADVKLVASSDAGMAMTRTSDLGPLLEFLVKTIGMPVLQTIRAATRTAAEALGIADETGTVVKGKRADLVLVDGNPMENVAALRRVDRVFRDGRVVVANGMLAMGGL